MSIWQGRAVGSVSKTPLYEVSVRVFQIAQNFWSTKFQTLWSNLAYHVYTVYFADRETWRRSVASCDLMVVSSFETAVPMVKGAF